MRPNNGHVVNYWMKYYLDKHCTLCGNSGVIDSRGVTTPVGVPCGRLNWCICPNGQSIRRQTKGEEPTQKFIDRNRLHYTTRPGF